MNKLKKYQLFEFLKVFKKNKCKTIDPGTYIYYRWAERGADGHH